MVSGDGDLPSCGFAHEGSFKFCPECGTPLAAPTCPLAEERKVVTSLFCDLGGFTATSESADPEDVDRMLAAYFAVARAQIEGHGGVVQKFIGDAVVGIFGVPVAHEDDPERAVRAGLRIGEDAEGLEGVGASPFGSARDQHGRGVRAPGHHPGLGGRFLTGDSVNTASRIRSVAPEMGVVVGFSTYEATAGVLDYEEPSPATLKGKAEPARVFHAMTPPARFGDRPTGDRRRAARRQARAPRGARAGRNGSSRPAPPRDRARA
jgi:class 3 adenylate cyclase